MQRTYDPSEPRRPDLAKPYNYQDEATDSILPGPPFSPTHTLYTLSQAADTLTWPTDLVALVSMFASGAAMITRFPIWVWIAVVFALSSILSQKSLAPNKKATESGSMLSGAWRGSERWAVRSPLTPRPVPTQAPLLSCLPRPRSSPSVSRICSDCNPISSR